MKKMAPDYNERIVKIEYQLSQDREHIDLLMTELKHIKSQYDLAMQRIDYLESICIKFSALISENFANSLIEGEKSNEISFKNIDSGFIKESEQT